MAQVTAVSAVRMYGRGVVQLSPPPEVAESSLTPASLTHAEGAALAERTRRSLTLALGACAIDGAFTVFVYLILVLPHPAGFDSTRIKLTNLVVLVVFLGVSVVSATVWSIRRAQPVSDWLNSGGEPSARVRELVVRSPRDQAVLMLSLWLAAAVVFGAVNLTISTATIAGDIFMTIGLAGLSVAALAYLITERVGRPRVARAFARSEPQTTTGIGVLPRILLTWAFCSGVPLLGIGLALIDRPRSDLPDLVAPTYLLVIVGLLVGLLGMVFAAKSISEPLAEVRAGMAAIGRGEAEARIPVDDMSEIGQLQAGFNHMVEGLNERRRLADLFGRHVGVEVARAALERGVHLGGEATYAAVLFVDIVGSTALAVHHTPSEVVARLNTFFALVVDVVERHGGWVNKFEGDAALCVFGAPIERDDAAACALAAARELRDRLQQISDVDAGIGVAAGTVIAGNVGAEQRYEYTVIGDPVNEAARLTELAKTRPERLVASIDVLTEAGPDEAARWRPEGEVTLRGRRLPTRLAVPAA